MKNILVTGAGGYVGSVLTKKLLNLGYFVRALDLFLYEKEPFRDYGKTNGKLEIFKADIRNFKLVDFALMDIDCVIHLACISNDPSFDLDPELGRSVNLDAFEPLVRMARNSGVSRFISASSSSVYGISDDPVVTEKSKCNPLTDYSKFKLETEQILDGYESSQFCTTSIRSATVCGYSPRQRLDVIVNILTNHAYAKKEITVLGGPQKRPNIHIDDLADLYTRMVELPEDIISGEVYNYGSNNYTVTELAKMVQTEFYPEQIEIRYKETNDPRSYHISSEKIFKQFGLKPKKQIHEAIMDLKLSLELGRLPNSMTAPRYFNVEMLKELKIK